MASGACRLLGASLVRLDLSGLPLGDARATSLLTELILEAPGALQRAHASGFPLSSSHDEVAGAGARWQHNAPV